MFAAANRCECTKPLMFPKSFEGDQRHVAVRALSRPGRLMERPRALAGNAAGLPVVVIVETANPAVVVQRHIQVHLVAGRAEIRLAHEGLQKGMTMRLRVELTSETWMKWRTGGCGWRPVRQEAGIPSRNRPGPWCLSPVTMAWQDMHPRPVWPSRVFDLVGDGSGRSLLAKTTAWS